MQSIYTRPLQLETIKRCRIYLKVETLALRCWIRFRNELIHISSPSEIIYELMRKEQWAVLLSISSASLLRQRELKNKMGRWTEDRKRWLLHINRNLMDPLKVFRSSIWTGVH